MPVHFNTWLAVALLTFKCVSTLLFAYEPPPSVIPYPANVVGLPVIEAKVCAGTLVK